MKKVVLSLPETFPLEAQEISIFLAAKLYEARRLSLGHAAGLAGLSKRTFAELLGRYGVSIINYAPEELAQDAGIA